MSWETFELIYFRGIEVVVMLWFIVFLIGGLF